MKIIIKNGGLVFQHKVVAKLNSFIALSNSSRIINYGTGGWTPSTLGPADLFKIDLPEGATKILLVGIGGQNAVSSDGKFTGTGCEAVNSTEYVVDGTTSLASIHSGKATYSYDSEADVLSITLPTGAKSIIFNYYISKTYGSAPSSVSVEFD